MNPHEKLRAFEDRVLGADATRIEGKVERGHGSRYRAMNDAEKTEHTALEQLIEAELKLQQATTALGEAQAHHAAVSARVEAHEKAAMPEPEPEPEPEDEQVEFMPEPHTEH